MNVGLDEDEARDLDRAVQQGPDLELDLERLELGHVGLDGAGHVGEAHILGLQRHARQQRKVQGALDVQLAPGRALDLGGELVLVGLGRDDERQRQCHADQHDDDAEHDQEELFHCAPRDSRATRPANRRACAAPASAFI
jgi:hypothetical protein